MRLIPLTQGKFAMVDDEDYAWLTTWKWYAAKDRLTYYARTSINHWQVMSMHRLLTMYPKKPLVPDHINHNGLDNQKHNLRIVTHRFNVGHKAYPGSSRYPGVSWHKTSKKWQSRVSVNYKSVYLGLFSEEIDAFKATLKYWAGVKSYLER